MKHRAYPRFYYCLCPFGTFWMYPTLPDQSDVELYLGDEYVDEFDSPADAAEAVRQHVTGHPGWDHALEYDAPPKLAQWGQLIALPDHRRYAAACS